MLYFGIKKEWLEKSLNTFSLAANILKSYVHLPENFNQNQNQNSLLVKRQTDNTTPGRKGSVGMKIFLFSFKIATKTAGSAQKTGSVGLAETQLFFRPYLIYQKKKKKMIDLILILMKYVAGPFSVDAKRGESWERI